MEVPDYSKLQLQDSNLDDEKALNKIVLLIFLQDLISTVVQRRGVADAAAAVAEKPVPKSVGWWLAGIAGMSFGAVAIGGLTRLTESGLSMVSNPRGFKVGQLCQSWLIRSKIFLILL